MSVYESIDGDELSIEQESDDLFSVVNFSRGKLSEHRYIVSTDDAVTHAIYCTCPHHKYRDAPCKHMRGVQAAINKELVGQSTAQEHTIPEELARYLSAGGLTAEEASGIAGKQF